MILFSRPSKQYKILSQNYLTYYSKYFNIKNRKNRFLIILYKGGKNYVQ